MNRFTPFIDPRGRRTGFHDGLIAGAAFATLVFAGSFAVLLVLLR